ncbi:MAG: dihydrolipoyl dehydrogenase [Alphaproteobacteria bacterium]|nr:dihydrolipoyl dehydrogenase [Alphaproteobacteria bacterium]
MADHYDLAVIGAGPGGYVAAIRAAQLGMKVACIDERPTLGGTCLNVGCIPSKALLSTSEKFAAARAGMSRIGIETGEVTLNLANMLAHKEKVVHDLTRGIEFLFSKNGVSRITGTARIEAVGRVAVEGDGSNHVQADRIMIATGSDSMPLDGLEVDERRVVTSTGALSFEQVPEHLVVVGGGYIGLEMGSVWSRLGSRVTVIEFLDRIVPGMDREIGERFRRALRRQGLQFRLSTRVTGATVCDDAIAVALEPAQGGDAETVECDAVLVAIGRRPRTAGLGLEELGVARDRHGFIEVDEDFETSVSGIFAIGDCIRGPMLAHKAEEDGVAAVEIMAGLSAHVDYALVPGIVYTHPEVAAIGETEETLKEGGVSYRRGVFPFSANSRARASGDIEGLVKMLAHADTDRVLGVHIIGPEAGTLIHECAAVMAFGGSAEDIARTCHGHPTLSEAVKEAALAVDERPIHA